MSPRTAYATLLNLSKTAWMDYIRPLEQQIIHTYSLRPWLLFPTRLTCVVLEWGFGATKWLTYHTSPFQLFMTSLVSFFAALLDTISCTCISSWPIGLFSELFLLPSGTWLPLHLSYWEEKLGLHPRIFCVPVWSITLGMCFYISEALHS